MKRLLLLSLVSLAFCFANSQALQLTHPVKGDVWPAYTVQRIQWQYANVDNIKIEVSADSAKTWLVIQSSYPATAGYYDWTVINKPSDSCFVRISDVTNISIQSSSYPGQPFRIPKPTITLDNADASVFGKTVLPISWTSSGVQSINLFTTYDNFLTYQLIAVNVPATKGFFNWIVKDTAAANVYVFIQSINDYSLLDAVDQPFIIKKLPAGTTNKYKGGSYDGHTSATNKAKGMQVLTPNKKEFLTSNTVYPITWSSTSINALNIKYSIDSGATWINIVSGTGASAAAYNWTVPATPSTRCLVKIADASDTTFFDVSDTTFIISPNALKFTAPAVKDTFTRGVAMPISWTSSGVSKVNITYVDGGVVKTVQSGVTAANEVYNWVVPTAISDSIKLRIADFDNALLTDSISKVLIKSTPAASAAKYKGGSYDGHTSATNKAPSLTIVTPNGNIQLASALPYSITWTSIAVSNVDLALSTDSGRTWQNIVTAYTNSQSYAWTVPGIASTKCLVRIRSSADSTISDVSDAVFTILPRQLNLLTDTTSIRYFTTAMSLEWSQQGIEKVSLNYKITKNGNYQKIKDSLTSTLEVYNWVVPNIASDSVWIKIFDYKDSLTKDEHLFAKVFKNLPAISGAKYLGGSFDGHTSRSTNNKINIFKPAANDTLKGGSTYPISWIVGNVTDSVTLQYSLDSGATWRNIANTAATNGQYQWTVPSGNANRAATAAATTSDILSDKCIVRAVSTGSSELIGISSKTFSIQQSLPANYFWVGGSGLWSDAGHWATTSGGTTFYTQPPSSANNVFFDANSFTAAGQTVTIDAPASCNNMNWIGVTNKPTMIVVGSNKLSVSGSVTTN